MNRIIALFEKRATLKNAIIVLLIFLLNVILLDRLDQPLLELAGGEPKLDLRFGYDVATVKMLFDAYGAAGRVIYIWNLIADTPFPVLGGLAVILFSFTAGQRAQWRKFAVFAPLVFIVTDVLENTMLIYLVQIYPEFPELYISVVSGITQLKRTAFYISALQLLISLLIIVYLSLRPDPGENAGEGS